MGPLPLLRRHLTRFCEGVNELKERRETQNELNERGETLFTEKAQRNALGVLKTNVAVQRVVKRELKVVDSFRTKLWLEKFKEATSTHRHLKALIEDTHVSGRECRC